MGMALRFGIQPFWFWNGKMEDGEIARQVREMESQGIRGFFIHPRQGLSVPYLSEEWFRKVGIAVEEAKKHGLEVWLYDEYPYPSGVSGGQVLLDHPEFEAKSLKRLVMEECGPKSMEKVLPWGQVILAKAYPLHSDTNKKMDPVEWANPVDLAAFIGTGYRENIFQMSGLTQYNRKRFFTGNPAKKLYWQAPEGRWHIEIILQTTVEHFKYFGKYIDTLNPNAIAYFIETTHEQYRKHFGPEFGKTIRGFFSDEVTAFPGSMPWSPTLPELFEKRNGYSLKDRLPALFERMGEDTDQVRYDYRSTVTDRFIQSYEIPIRDWCHNNHLLYAGEKPVMRSRQLKYFDIPGIDAGHQKVGSIPLIASPNYRANGKMAGSAAHFYKKPGALCECFHSIGWGMTLQDMKWVFDWLALQGICWFVPHAFFYTTDGLTKHDAPPSSFYQNPNWRYTGLLSDYAGKITEVITRSRREVPVLLLDPISSQWTAMGEKRIVNKKLKEDFSALQRLLLSHHLDYYIIDPELLGQCTISDHCIQVNGEKFELLILPPMLNIEDDAYFKVKEYVENDGKLIGSLCLPVEQIGKVSDVGLSFSRWFHMDAGKVYREYLQGKKGVDDTDWLGYPTLSNEVNCINKAENTNKPVCPGDSGSLKNEAVIFADDLKTIPELIGKLLDRDISVETEKDGEQDGSILSAVYKHENKTTCFLINASGAEHRVKITLRADGMQSPGLTCLPIGPEDGKPIPYKQQGQRIHFHLMFYPYQSFLLEMEGRKAEDFGAEGKKSEDLGAGGRKAEDGRTEDPGTEDLNQIQQKVCESIVRRNLDMDGDWSLSVDRMNSLRLGTWNLQIKDDPKEYRVNCQPIINQIADAGIPLPVHLKEYFGCPREMEFPPLSCRYRTTFQLGADAAIRPVLLVMEPGSIEGKWYAEINGHQILPGDFHEKAIYLPTNQVTDITDYLKTGINEIRVWVDTKYHHDGLVNPLYLSGNFSVYQEEQDGVWRMESPKATGRIGDRKGNGLPFYAGTIQYTRQMDSEAGFILDDKEEEWELSIRNPYFQDAAELYINGHSAGVRAWSPYTWRIKKGWLKSKDNEVRLQVTTTLMGLFEGQYFDPDQHQYRNIENS